jgi:predicted metalloprotease with PDZ domain
MSRANRVVYLQLPFIFIWYWLVLSLLTKRMKRHLSLIIICLLAVPFSGSPAGIKYSVGFSEPQAHYTDVTMDLQALAADSTDFKMPVWIPGSYMVREFSRMVESFTAADEQGRELKWKKVTKNAWRVYFSGTPTIKVKYRVYCFELSVRNSFVDYDRAMLNGSSVFMYTEQHRNDSCHLTVLPAPHWRNISTGMPKSGPDSFKRVAADYDELIDCPILLGNHPVFSFEMNGIPHYVAMMGKAVYDSVQLKKDFQAITAECTSIFGSNPVKDYTFIVMNTPSGGGGLEHRNSTVIQVTSSAYQTTSSYRSFLSLVAHEYFHLWLVKRIRDVKLGPFDYDNEVYTTQLWLYEGFTSFYDDYILYRCGIYPENEYLDIVKGNIATVVNTPGNQYQSLTESSFDAWIKFYRKHENSNNSTVSYYVQGGVLAIMMNLDLLNRSNGTRSLDDLMRYLYDFYLSNKVGISDEQLFAACEKIWGAPLDDFFKNHIYGTRQIPYEEYLMYAGLRLNRTDGHLSKPGYTGAVISQKSGNYVIAGVERGSPAWTDGLNVNDEILAVDTVTVNILAYLDTKSQGDKVVFKCKRLGEEKLIPVSIGTDPKVSYVFEDVRKPDARQKAVRNGWLIKK